MKPCFMAMIARMEQFSRDAKAVRAWMQTQAITEAWLPRWDDDDGIFKLNMDIR